MRHNTYRIMLPDGMQSLDIRSPIRKSDLYKNPPSTRTWKDLIRKLHRISRSSGIGPWNNSMSSFKLHLFTCIINYNHFRNTAQPLSRIRQCNWQKSILQESQTKLYSFMDRDYQRKLFIFYRESSWHLQWLFQKNFCACQAL